MVRRYVAPILRFLAFLCLLASPLLLAALARAEEPDGKNVVALRSVVLGGARPTASSRVSRLLDLARARVVEPAAAAEPELLTAGAPGEDRYTTSLGFSPDGCLLLVICEGFTPDGVRIPKRHVLCDTDGAHRPVLVDRRYAAPGVVDWNRLQQMTARLSG